MSLEQMATAALQGLLAREKWGNPHEAAMAAVEHARALQAELAQYEAEPKEETEGAYVPYDELKARIPTDDRLWQSSKNEETRDAE